MAPSAQPRGRFIIGLTFLVAFVLTIVPLPDWFKAFRPEWVALTLIYWCIAVPQRIGVGSAWLSGLLLDVLRGGMLGQHALALAVIAFLILKVHRQFRVFPLWQQALFICALIIIYQLLVMWLNSIVGIKGDGWRYWLPSLSSALLWPWMFVILRDVRRHFGIN